MLKGTLRPKGYFSCWTKVCLSNRLGEACPYTLYVQLELTFIKKFGASIANFGLQVEKRDTFKKQKSLFAVNLGLLNTVCNPDSRRKGSDPLRNRRRQMVWDLDLLSNVT